MRACSPKGAGMLAHEFCQPSSRVCYAPLITLLLPGDAARCARSNVNAQYGAYLLLGAGLYILLVEGHPFGGITT